MVAHDKSDKTEKKAPTRTYKLLAGQHQAADHDAKPTKVRSVDPDTGDYVVTEKYPTRTFTPGQVITSDKPLDKLFGENKFQEVTKRGRRYEPVTEDDYVDEVDEHGESKTYGDPTPLNAQAPRTFPHGQVLQGHPATSGSPDPASLDIQRQFAQTPEEAAEMADKHADRVPSRKERMEKAKKKATEREKGEGRSARKSGRSSSSSSSSSGNGGEADTDFHAMKKDELIAYAEEKGIDLGDATYKEDIIKKLEKNRK